MRIPVWAASSLPATTTGSRPAPTSRSWLSAPSWRPSTPRLRASGRGWPRCARHRGGGVGLRARRLRARARVRHDRGLGEGRIRPARVLLGIIPGGGGGAQRLARVIGKQRAMELMLTGRRIDTAEARAGHRQPLTPPKDWLESALGLAEVDAATAAGRADGQAGRAGRRRDAARRGPRARTPPVRAGHGHRGPRTERLPGEAQAGVPGTVILGVVGAGTMGAGIAQLGCAAGMRTLLHDPAPKRWSAGRSLSAAGSPAGRRKDG